MDAICPSAPQARAPSGIPATPGPGPDPDRAPKGLVPNPIYQKMLISPLLALSVLTRPSMRSTYTHRSSCRSLISLG